MGFIIGCLILTTAISIFLAYNSFQNRTPYKEPPVTNNERVSGDPAVCPQCGKMSTLMPPVKRINEDQVESTFKCPDGHLYTKILPIK
jgi:hypothetical protein